MACVLCANQQLSPLLRGCCFSRCLFLHFLLSSGRFDCTSLCNLCTEPLTWCWHENPVQYFPLETWCPLALMLTVYVCQWRWAHSQGPSHVYFVWCGCVLVSHRLLTRHKKSCRDSRCLGPINFNSWLQWFLSLSLCEILTAEFPCASVAELEVSPLP